MPENEELLWVRNHIDWMCKPGDEGGAGNASPSRLRHWKAPVLVGLGLIPAWRGPIGAKDCVNYAILYGWLNIKNASLSWLKAGQAHNDDAKKLFDKYSDYAIDYAVSKYSQQAAIKFSLDYFGNDNNWINSNRGFLERNDNFISQIPEPTAPSNLNDDDLNPRPIIDPRDPGGNARH
jgi:hypothetical protein